MKIIRFALFFTLAFLFYACACKTCEQQSGFEISVPDSIFEKADKFVTAKVGTKFFKENFFRDFIKSKKTPDGYFIEYNYRSMDYDFVDEPVYFSVDSSGNVLKNQEIVGIPNCRYSPENCAYNVNEEEAMSIAEENRLPEGIRKWDAAFRWNADLKQYVWQILSTTWEIGKADNYKARGKEIIIDPHDGSVLKFRDWEIR